MLFSGSSFVVALLGMLLVPDTIMRSLALGAIIVGMVTVAAALTLLPALLSLLGDRVNALRVPFVGRDMARQPRAASGRAVVRGVMRRPVLQPRWPRRALLLAAAIPVLGLQHRERAGSARCPTGSRKAGLPGARARASRQRDLDPAQIVVSGDVSAPRCGAAIDQLRA